MFMARVADRKRGWGKFCSKSCKATKQEYITGQYKSYLRGNYGSSGKMSKIDFDRIDFESAMDGATTSHGQDGTGGV